MTASPVRSEILALIPARGGSKGIPHKNLVVLLGKPLIAFSIEQALGSAYITRTIVSTDDAEIAQVSRSSGAEVPFMRPVEYAQDLSPDIDVFRHALDWLSREEGYHPELVVHLRPTGPVRQVEVIDRAIGLMRKHPEADSLRSVAWPIQTPYKMWRMRTDGYLEPLLQVEGIADSHSVPRQMLPEVFWQNGFVDIVRPRTVLDQSSMAGQKVLPFIVNEPIYELDYPEAIPVIEAALERLAQGESPAEPDNYDATKRHPV